jgi:2'-5' RNA ligase
MRLFVGIDLPGEVRHGLSAAIAGLRPYARVNWSPTENLHITTKFIGEWPDERLDEIVAALRGLEPMRPFRISISGLGWFPNSRFPRIFWTGVHADAALTNLAGATERAVARLGVPLDRHPYSPHLTLARIRDGVPVTRLQEELAGRPPAEFGAFHADRFYLFLSERRSSGSIYTKLEEFPLSKS